ncbi:hypothetical protein, partial [Mycolicibacterium sp. 018/SC-01/001]|uniref:hypothetical protein n=1 Tax=Mycolicibacterium sp. 018/SC-01/001 TaxID=2592069 RepID=UPI001C8F8BF8
EPGSNSPNKNPGTHPAEFESEKSDHNNQKHLAKNRCAPKRENADTTKKQQTKTTKHTIEFSNNSPDLTAHRCRGGKPRTGTAGR